MAKIPCPGCNKNISENAEACPKCGEPLTPEKVEAAKKKQKKFTIGCLSVFLALFLLGSIGKSCSSENQQTTNTASVQTVQASTPILGIDAGEYLKAIDKYAAELNLRITDVKSSEGSVKNSVSAMLGCCAHISVFTTKDEPAKVADVLLTLGSDGTPTAGGEMILAMADVIMATDPGKPAEYRGGIIKEMGFTSGKLPDDVSVIRGNKKYWFKNIPGMAAMFGVEAIN
ncbi:MULTISPECIES: hypothetical protein [unclassified Maridesulfovibrio]|uniref:hypothetical protein n=1 Tax=unclassified Maridesulfovibrio TaxID=2794999 RepID=UPI003B3FE5DE